jgi:hypothetical protein
MVMSRALPEQQMMAIERLAFVLAEEERVSKLPDRELVREVLLSTAADNPCVVEILNRFMPGWDNLNWEG